MPAFSDLWYLTHTDPVQALIFQIPNGAVLGVREQLPLNPSQRVNDIREVWHPKPACWTLASKQMALNLDIYHGGCRVNVLMSVQ